MAFDDLRDERPEHEGALCWLCEAPCPEGLRLCAACSADGTCARCAGYELVEAPCEGGFADGPCPVCCPDEAVRHKPKRVRITRGARRRWARQCDSTVRRLLFVEKPVARASKPPLGSRAHRHEPVVVLKRWDNTAPPSYTATIDGDALHLSTMIRISPPPADGERAWFLAVWWTGHAPVAVPAYGNPVRLPRGGSRRQRRARYAVLRAVARALREGGVK